MSRGDRPRPQEIGRAAVGAVVEPGPQRSAAAAGAAREASWNLLRNEGVGYHRMAKMVEAPFVRRVLYLLAALLPVWTVIAFFTGGVGWMLGPIRLSSRQPLRPLLIGLA